MTQHSRRGHLSFIRHEIAAMRIVKCRMAHERVIGLADSKLPMPDSGSSGHFKRVGLCSPELRAERLGCSHTMSRSKLDRAIDELDSGAAEDLRYELNWLTNEIHLLDHRKGEAEARQARAEVETKVRGGGTSVLEVVKESEIVRELEMQHDLYVERIGALRDKVVSALDKKIEELGQRMRERASPEAESILTQTAETRSELLTLPESRSRAR